MHIHLLQFNHYTGGSLKRRWTTGHLKLHTHVCGSRVWSQWVHFSYHNFTFPTTSVSTHTHTTKSEIFKYFFRTFSFSNHLFSAINITSMRLRQIYMIKTKTKAVYLLQTGKINRKRLIFFAWNFPIANQSIDSIISVQCWSSRVNWCKMSLFIVQMFLFCILFGIWMMSLFNCSNFDDVRFFSSSQNIFFFENSTNFTFLSVFLKKLFEILFRWLL